MEVMIRRYKMEPGSFKEISQKVNHVFLPILQKIEGFHDYYIFETGKDALVTVSIFKEKKGADESVRKAAEFVRENNLSQYLPTPPEVMTGKDTANLHNKSGLKETTKEGPKTETASKERAKS